MQRAQEVKQQLSWCVAVQDARTAKGRLTKLPEIGALDALRAKAELLSWLSVQRWIGLKVVRTRGHAQVDRQRARRLPPVRMGVPSTEDRSAPKATHKHPVAAPPRAVQVPGEMIELFDRISGSPGTSIPVEDRRHRRRLSQAALRSSAIAMKVGRGP
jgi:hypothetical protein